MTILLTILSTLVGAMGLFCALLGIQSIREELTNSSDNLIDRLMTGLASMALFLISIVLFLVAIALFGVATKQIN